MLSRRIISPETRINATGQQHSHAGERDQGPSDVQHLQAQQQHNFQQTSQVQGALQPGGIQRPELSQLRDGLHEVLHANCVGPSVVTEAFLSLLRNSTCRERRIVNVSSALGQIGLAFKAEHEWNARNVPVLAYRISKAALNMLTAVKAMELADENILVVSVAPGYTQTVFSGGQGSEPAAEGAKAIVRAITDGFSQEMFGTLVANECTEFGR